MAMSTDPTGTALARWRAVSAWFFLLSVPALAIAIPLSMATDFVLRDLGGNMLGGQQYDFFRLLGYAASFAIGVWAPFVGAKAIERRRRPLEGHPAAGTAQRVATVTLTLLGFTVPLAVWMILLIRFEASLRHQ